MPTLLRPLSLLSALSLSLSLSLSLPSHAAPNPAFDRLVNALADAAAAACAGAAGVSSVVNGRFKGGYITRQYGRPEDHVHAIQLEKCQSLYMQEIAPFAYDEGLAKSIQPVLENMVRASLAAACKLYGR